jgi:hypothetical protein
MLEQGDDVQGAALFDRFMQASERTDVNHGIITASFLTLHILHI